jgi:hypothetical protein
MADEQDEKKCVKCSTPFDETDMRFYGARRQHKDSPFCSACVDACMSIEVADHWCVVDAWKSER